MNKTRRHRLFFGLVMLLPSVIGLRAYSQTQSSAIPSVRFVQHPGDSVPLDLTFRDENSETVRLRDYCTGRPIVIAPVYFECPMLCNQVLNGLGKSLETVSLNPGSDFVTLAISFDPTETFDLADRKRTTYLDRFDRAGLVENWHFLTGDQPEIKSLTDAIGFEYEYDEKTDQYAHPAGVVIITPDGKISRYLFGVEYAPRDLRLALVEASEGTIGGITDDLLLLCFRYDPTKGKYGLLIMRVLRGGAVVTLLALGGVIYFSARSRSRHPIEIEDASSQNDKTD